jgi:hypothetical protein
MEIMTTENKRIAEYALGGIVGLISAGYLAPYLSSNIYELLGGVAILFGTFYLVKGTNGYKGPLKLALGILGLIFIIRGALGFVPSVRAEVDKYTMNIL